MPNPVPATSNAALLPDPPLFDVTQVAQPTVDGMLERVALEHLQLAPNPRQQLTHDSIHTLAGLLMRTGQLIPCIGRRPQPDNPKVILFDGQRRLLAAHASHQLAGTEGYEGLSPVTALIVLLLDHDPTQQEIRRVQAQANQREELALVDQQRQFADCWPAPASRTITASPPSAQIWGSPQRRRTTCAASSRCPTSSVSASPTGPPTGSCR